MSIEAINWVLNEAPDLPPHLFAVMMGLANHADPFGEGSRPSQSTLAWYTRKSERAVRKDIADALERGLIRRGNQKLVDHLPPDRRPVVYDLALEGSREPRRRGRHGPPRPAVDNQPDGGGTVVPPGPSIDDNGRNCGSPPGGTVVPVAGGTVVPPNHKVEPSVEPSIKNSPLPPAADGRAVAAPGRNEGGKDPHEETAQAFVANLPRALPGLPPLTPRAHGALITAITKALQRGIPMPRIADALIANPPTVTHNLGALLASRVGQLEVEPTRPRRLPWCGRCDSATRMVDDEVDGRPVAAPCPECSPQLAGMVLV